MRLGKITYKQGIADCFTNDTDHRGILKEEIRATRFCGKKWSLSVRQHWGKLCAVGIMWEAGGQYGWGDEDSH